MRVKLLFLIPAVAYTLGILYLSLINLAETPVKELGLSDKFMHVGAYFILTVLWMIYLIFSYSDKKFLLKLILVSVVSVVFGIFIEVLQYSLTTYRQLDIFDMLANCAGVIGGGLGVWLVKDFLTRLKAKINLFFIKK